MLMMFSRMLTYFISDKYSLAHVTRLNMHLELDFFELTRVKLIFHDGSLQTGNCDGVGTVFVALLG